MSRNCPYCGSAPTVATKQDEYFECGTRIPYDWHEIRSEECKKRQDEKERMK